jgi:hypothetical protein
MNVSVSVNGSVSPESLYPNVKLLPPGVSSIGAVRTVVGSSIVISA